MVHPLGLVKNPRRAFAGSRSAAFLNAQQYATWPKGLTGYAISRPAVKVPCGLNLVQKGEFAKVFNCRRVVGSGGLCFVGKASEMLEFSIYANVRNPLASRLVPIHALVSA